MRGLLLASVAMMAGPAAPPAPPPADKPPCTRPGTALEPLRPDKPTDAQRFNPGLY